MTEDAELLHRFAEERAEEAFAELVRRNIDLVYAVALRHVGDAHLADDVVQSVFIDLARKARALGRHPALASWLYTSARFAALKVMRSEYRRRTREQEAYAMDTSNEPAADWERLRPVLDDVLNALGERDREIVLLRFFRGLPFAAIGRGLQVSEGAARMRAERALEKMGQLLGRHGIHSTSAALAVALATQPGIAAPPALAASVTAAALQSAAHAGILGAAGTVFLAMSKLKLVTAALLVAAITTATVEVRANLRLRSELQATPAANLSRITRENRALQSAVAQAATDDPNIAQLGQLRARLATLKARPPGVTDQSLHPPQNLGRATPNAACETFCWAVSQRDLDTVASFVRFREDTPENRTAFMARFSAALRDRYRTPERLTAAALFGATIVAPRQMPDQMDAMQVVRVRERDANEVRVEIWMHSERGQEIAGGDTYTLGADGWGMRALALDDPNVIGAIQERLDPVTGEFRPPKRNLRPSP